MSVRKRFRFLPAFAIAIAFFGTLIASTKVSALASAENFHVTNLEFWGGNVRLDGTDNETCRSNDCLYSLKFDWTYQSIDPIVAGDSFTVDYLTAKNEYGYNIFSMTTTDWTTVKDIDGNGIFQWRNTSNKTLEFKFLEGAAGKTALSGHLETSRNIKTSGYLGEKTLIPVQIDGSDPVYIWVSKVVYNKLSSAAGQVWFNTANDKSINWRLYGNTYPGNYLYSKALKDELTPETTLPIEQEVHDYMMELTFLTEGSTYGLPTFSAALPMPSNTGTNDQMSSQVYGVNVNNYYRPKQVQQNEGESYEDFKNRLEEGQWGLYKDSTTGFTTFVGKYGDFPSNNLTYTKMFSEGYANKSSFDDWLDSTFGNNVVTKAIGRQVTEIVSSDSFYNDGYLFPMVTITETVAPGSGIDSLSVSATFSWTDGNGTAKSVTNNLTRPIYPVPESIVSEMGGLQLVLSDQTNHGKISSDAGFKLEHQNGGAWEDYGTLQKNNSGNYAITGLTPGETYRIVETSYPEHYQSGSLALYSDAGYSTSVSDTFVAPDDSGTVLYATNAKQTFTVTFDPNGGQLSNNYRQRVVEYGTATATLDPRSYVTPPVGKVFDSWSPAFASTVTENVTYTAQYKDKTKNVRARIVWADAGNVDGVRPESVIVTLYQTIDGQTRPYDVTKIASSSNNYTVEWSDMKTHHDGTEIGYNAGVQDSDYTYEATTGSDGYITITGTYNPQVIVKVVKDWDDNGDTLGARPNDNEVVFHISADGSDSGESFTLADGESASLNAYSSLTNPITKINYTISEETIPGYETLSVEKVSEENGYITYRVTNRKLTPTAVTSDPIVIPVSPEEGSLEDGEQITATLVPRNDAYPMPDDDTSTIDKDTTAIEFDGVEYTEPGRYEYDIEIPGDEYADVDVDIPVITVIVDVTYDKDTDSLVSTTNYYVDGEPFDPSDLDIIIRHLDPVPITEDIAIQLPVDDEIEEGAIDAKVTPKPGSPMPEGSDDSIDVKVNPDGSIVIENVKFTEPGEYDYDIKLSSDEYDIGTDEFTIRVVVELDEDTNTLSIGRIVAIDKDGNEIDLNSLKLNISRKANNPDTIDRGAAMTATVAGATIAALGLLFYSVRRRRI